MRYIGAAPRPQRVLRLLFPAASTDRPDTRPTVPYPGYATGAFPASTSTSRPAARQAPRRFERDRRHHRRSTRRSAPGMGAIDHDRMAVLDTRRRSQLMSVICQLPTRGSSIWPSSTSGQVRVEARRWGQEGQGTQAPHRCRWRSRSRRAVLRALPSRRCRGRQRCRATRRRTQCWRAVRRARRGRGRRRAGSGRLIRWWLWSRGGRRAASLRRREAARAERCRR